MIGFVYKFPQTFRSFHHATSKYQQAKKPTFYFVCDICFQPFKTTWDVLSHKSVEHTRLYCTAEHLEMPLEINIKEQYEVPPDVLDSLADPDMNISGHIQDREAEPQLSSSEDDEQSNSKNSFGSASKGFRTNYHVQQHGDIESADTVESVADLDQKLSSDEELCNLKKDSRKINPKYPRLFPCHLCGKSFTRNYDMHKHQKQQHPEAAELMLKEDLTLFNYSNRKLCQIEHVHETTEDGSVKLTMKRRVRKTYEKEEEDKISKARVIVDGVKFFHCDVCNHHLKSKYSFVTHLRIHSGEKPFTCHVCGRQFRVWEQLQRHVSDVHDKIKNYECHICGRKFATVNTRNEHLFTHSQDRTFVCHMCGKAFRSNGTLRVHYKFHTDIFPHQCPHCDKRFRMRQHFDNHLRVHTGEKPHACTICGKHFRTKWCVKKHTLIHTSTETFECVVCRKRYSQKRYLRNHMRLSHGVRFTGNRMTD